MRQLAELPWFAANVVRKLLIVGVCAGSSASIPILYESNPDAFERLLRPAAHEQPAAEAPQPARMAPPDVVETMPGRKVRIAADARGHFSGEFKINGRRVRGMVDTGATMIGMGAAEAERLDRVAHADACGIPPSKQLGVQRENQAREVAVAAKNRERVIAIENEDHGPAFGGTPRLPGWVPQWVLGSGTPASRSEEVVPPSGAAPSAPLTAGCAGCGGGVLGE